LQYLNLSFNNFSGSLDLTQLPSQLKELHVGNNRFTGFIDLSRLPMNLAALYLNDNQLSGFIGAEGSDIVDERNCDASPPPSSEGTCASNTILVVASSNSDSDAQSPSMFSGVVVRKPFRWPALPPKFRMMNVSNNPLEVPLPKEGQPKQLVVWRQ